MPAPDTDTLFDLETAFTAAMATILAGHGFNIYQLQGEEVMADPRLELSFEVGPVTEHVGYMPNGEPYYDTWKCSASICVITNRRDTIRRHGATRGRVRRVLQDVRAQFTPDILPYHSIARMVDRGSRASVTDHEEDKTEFTFDVDLSIRREAWPAV